MTIEPLPGNLGVYFCLLVPGSGRLGILVAVGWEGRYTVRRVLLLQLPEVPYIRGDATSVGKRQRGGGIGENRAV